MAGRANRSQTKPITNDLYSEEMARAIRRLDKPVPFTMDVVDKGDHLALRVYEDEILNLGLPDRIRVMDYVTTCQRVIESFGVQCITEGAKGEPGRR